MGNLPAERVTRARPFAQTGFDYAGPFQIKSTKGRGVNSSKGYLAIFVCLSTKAVHLEVVGDLTTESFLAAVRRSQGDGACLINCGATTRPLFEERIQLCGRCFARNQFSGLMLQTTSPIPGISGGLYLHQPRTSGDCGKRRLRVQSNTSNG